MTERPPPCHRPPAASAPARGFSLIELMIVIAIVGILAGIAYPAYGKYARETRRSDGHFALLSAAQAMERCRSTRFSYAGCTVPAASPENYYTVTLTEQSASAFTVTATGVGAQASDTDCATITIDHLGTQGPLESNGDPSECW